MADISEAIRKKKLLIIAGLMSLMLGLGMVPVGGSMGVQQVSANCGEETAGAGATAGTQTQSRTPAEQKQWEDCSGQGQITAEMLGQDIYNECRKFFPGVEYIDPCRSDSNKYQNEIYEWAVCDCMDPGNCGGPPTGPIYESGMQPGNYSQYQAPDPNPYGA